MSPVIWNAASTGPPRAAPTTSPTTAPNGGVTIPEPSPATADRATTSHGAPANPAPAVAAAPSPRPSTRGGRRPRRSANVPAASTTDALPAANALNAAAASPGPPCTTSVTNSGSSDIRTPNAAQPLARLPASAARYAGRVQASRAAIVASPARVGAPSSGEWRSAQPTPQATAVTAAA